MTSIRAQLTSLLHPQRRQLHVALGLGLLSAVVMIINNALLATLFARWLQLSAGSGQPQAYQAAFLALIPFIALCVLLRPMLTWLKEHLLQQVSLTVRQSLRVRLLAALATLGPARRYLGSDGELSSQVIDQVDGLDGYISRYYVQQRLVVFVPLMIVAAVSWYSVLAAVLLLLTAPLVPLFMVLLGRAAANKNRAQFQALARLSGQYLDWLRGLPTLRRLQAVGQVQHSINEGAQHYRQRTMAVLRLAFLSSAVLELFAALSIALVAVYLGLGLIGVLPWAKGDVPVAYQGALFILLLAPEFYQPLRQLGADYHDKAKAEAAIEALSPLLALDLAEDGGEKSVLNSSPGIIVDNLSMVAPDGRTRLHTCSFTVKPGERIALSGASGVGKSSVLQALLGFAPYSGEIVIGGHSLANLNKTHWRSYVAYLAQQAPIMPISIAENLRLAAAQASDAQLNDVLEQVGLLGVVQALPQGIETPLGERGQGLSGGQLQRLALAQLLLRNTPIWLLDEPTAHLDPSMAVQILALIGKLSVGKTLILVSHDAQQATWLDRVHHLVERDRE
ncbi:thiol reductant ABC exporter subunit CydD [Suttonella sp. R2A3]|uniref:thiol reductant ABC exporter subunit CydD n=1 Tax=Suttonella sp. R2A3 TaxID=2908648 RepID=UPI001F46DDC1|nr:thiol reductant ABC exporter subunit CydD [Suttonella sp. R2A3]UJF24675.1 thiol reductant ABC exporter subunit CydD [Suttonella sp. R2A3]